MTDELSNMTTSELNEATQYAWNTNAEFWNERMGEGNDFHKLLIEPAQLRLLDVKPGMRILDLACGNGQFARKLASLGANVVASDFAPKMIELAKSRTTENADRIEYHVIDATDEAQLIACGERSFDAAVCTMGIMDIAEIEPMASALRLLLKPGSPFVFSVTHPCFNLAWPKMSRVVEEEDREGVITRTYSVKVSGYATPSANKGLAMVGQPEAQFYFERPFNVLYATFFERGFSMDGMEEPIFDKPEIWDKPLMWENFRDIPPVLVTRMRLTAGV